MTIRSIFGHRAFFPLFAFAALLVVLFVTLGLTDRSPTIDRISPEIGLPGGVLVIEGRNFGDRRGSSEVTLAGVRLTTISYLEWGDRRISVRIPEEAGAGPVRIRTDAGESNGVLFTNRNLVPVVLTEKTRPGIPFIESVDPEKGAVGTLITIEGFNFGLSRGDGKVLFAALPVGEESEGAGNTLAASTLDFDYEGWTEQTVRVRVPDGASSGSVRIVTDRGESNAVFFEVSARAGTKSLKRHRGFQLAAAVEVDSVVASGPGTIKLWVPGVIATPAQRNVEIIRTPEPSWIDGNGVSRYEVSDFEEDIPFRIELVYWLDRYAVETRLTPARVVLEYDTQTRLYRRYTAADALVPADDESIVAAAASAAGSERNPYLIAKSVYLFLLVRMDYDRKSPAKSVADSFVAARGDSEDYALLYCALLRSLGIPARPVAGALVYGPGRAIRHVWAEFYVSGFGWVPVDPVLGDGVRFGDFPDLESPEKYYFGNLDAQRIVFSRGYVDVDSGSETAGVRVANAPSLQSKHESATGGVESYRATWEPVRVIYFW